MDATIPQLHYLEVVSGVYSIHYLEHSMISKCVDLYRISLSYYRMYLVSQGRASSMQWLPSTGHAPG